MNLDYRTNKRPRVLPKPNQRATFFKLKEARTLPPMTPMKPDSAEAERNGGYCEYHQDYGHVTKHYMHLARAINQSTSNKREELPRPPRAN